MKIVNTKGITKAMRSTPKTGAEHTDLHAVGKSDSMLEFVSAVPNGSVDGRLLLNKLSFKEMKMVRKVILSLLVSFTISGSYAEETYPQDVSSFIEKRELCDHFRGEISGEPDVDNERNLNELLDQYCKGTDQVLKTLKLKYVDNKSVLEKLNTFELIECTNNCSKEVTVMKHQFSDYPVTNIVRKAKGKYKANFAGHYLFTTYGCGGGAICGEIIDVNTGKFVIGLPNPYLIDGIDGSVPFMADYQLDSSLIIISGITGDTETDSDNNVLDKINRIRYYNFVNGELVLIEYDEIRDLY